ncbi:peptidoglycan-recognition protein 1-like [Macrosteles quadrilineatus]|uniref:peptidoglycan-recognition protein 1-like n=1 Tax=Macrosteles quadrilineatus TaxID=74068 RepID=UPI0023E15E62|nr:peptidoglycan-recognition protein 1-like [Macrosteles quadrilineatus]
MTDMTKCPGDPDPPHGTELITTKEVPDCVLEEVGLQLVEPEPYVKRKRWGAMDPVKPPVFRDCPPSRIVVVDTGTSQCKTLEQCSLVLQQHQEQTIYEGGQSDLPYNFMVGGDGRVYEGRGWRAKIALPETFAEEYEDDISFIIGLIGDFSSSELEICPPEKMVKARRQFVLLGKDVGIFDREIEIWTELQWKV